MGEEREGELGAREESKEHVDGDGGDGRYENGFLLLSSLPISLDLDWI